MPRTKYDFMRDMLILARNKHRKELGLCPEQPEAVGPALLTSEPRSSTERQAVAFDGTQDNPMPLGSKDGAG